MQAYFFATKIAAVFDDKATTRWKGKIASPFSRVDGNRETHHP